MKISKIKTHNLRNDAHFQFHTYCLNQDWQQENNLVAAQSLRFVSQDYRINRINQINSLLNIGKIFESWESGFRQQATTKHFESIIREAAERLKIVFDTYGNLATQPLNEETSAIYNLLQELEGKYAREAETVGIKQWVAELKKRNTALSDLMKDRFDETADKSDIVVKQARAELDAAYRTIIERIDALAIVEGVKNYESVIKKWNAVVDKYANSLRHRRGGDLSHPNEDDQSAEQDSAENNN